MKFKLNTIYRYRDGGSECYFRLLNLPDGCNTVMGELVLDMNSQHTQFKAKYRWNIYLYNSPCIKEIRSNESED